MMLIFAHEISPRLSYACAVLFDPLGIAWELTDDEDVFSSHEGLRISYSATFPIVQGMIPLHPSGLLTERGIQFPKPAIGKWDGLVTLFPNESTAVPFDIFSSVFYLITRYEEYQPFTADSMGRFEAGVSLAGMEGFLGQPLIDQWRMKFLEIIHARWPHVGSRTRFTVSGTIDVDSAFAFRHKGLKRTFLAIGKDVVSGRTKNLIRRLSIVASGGKDPYDTYDHILQLQVESGIPLIFFFLLANFSRHDRGLHHTSVALVRTIRQVARTCQVGIHPGVASNHHPRLLQDEISRLADILGKPVLNSRQHYLMLSFPETYRRLLDCGIRDEYSMGYATRPGFRASTSLPFRWYDLYREEVTSLTVHPFAVMDTTLAVYEHLHPDEAIHRIQNLISVVHACGGCFAYLWHNESLSDMGHWKGWKRVYDQMLHKAEERKDS